MLNIAGSAAKSINANKGQLQQATDAAAEALAKVQSSWKVTTSDPTMQYAYDQLSYSRKVAAGYGVLSKGNTVDW